MSAMTQQSGVTVHATDEGVGAVVSGLDLATGCDAELRAWIYQAVLDHGVLVFRDQDLDAAAFHDFASGFGPLHQHILRKYRHKQYPDLSWLTNVEEDGSVDRFGVTRATAWHTDGSYTDNPPALGLLHALEVPSKGAGTFFVSMKNAYAAAPDADKALVGPLIGLHRHGAGPAGGMYNNAGGDPEDPDHDFRHPAVRPHPATGAPVLYVSPTHTRCFEGMTPEDSAALVTRLVDNATHPGAVYHHQWRPGDLLIWDEHGTMHRGEGAYEPTERRVMMRAIVQSVA